MRDDANWFAGRRFGYGAGRPIRWQGWALLGLLVVAVAVAARVEGWRRVTVIALAVAVFARLAAPSTRGGWRRGRRAGR